MATSSSAQNGMPTVVTFSTQRASNASLTWHQEGYVSVKRAITNTMDKLCQALEVIGAKDALDTSVNMVPSGSTVQIILGVAAWAVGSAMKRQNEACPTSMQHRVDFLRTMCDELERFDASQAARLRQLSNLEELEQHIQRCAQLDGTLTGVLLKGSNASRSQALATESTQGVTLFAFTVLQEMLAAVLEVLHQRPSRILPHPKLKKLWQDKFDPVAQVRWTKWWRYFPSQLELAPQDLLGELNALDAPSSNHHIKFQICVAQPRPWESYDEDVTVADLKNALEARHFGADATDRQLVDCIKSMAAMTAP